MTEDGGRGLFNFSYLVGSKLLDCDSALGEVLLVGMARGHRIGDIARDLKDKEANASEASSSGFLLFLVSLLLRRHAAM